MRPIRGTCPIEEDVFLASLLNELQERMWYGEFVNFIPSSERAPHPQVLSLLFCLSPRHNYLKAARILA